MNVYDFDGTIYDGDSTKDFYFYCIKKKKKVLRLLPFQVTSAIKYKLKKQTKTKFKEDFYCFLKDFDNIDEIIEEFWSTHEHKIKKWYLNQSRADDIVISASPEFLLEPMLKRLGTAVVIASKVDKNTGKYEGVNCHNSEKVKRFSALYNIEDIDEFYSDSYVDSPMAEIAKKSFLCKKNDVFPWK